MVRHDLPVWSDTFEAIWPILYMACHADKELFFFKNKVEPCLILIYVMNSQGTVEFFQRLH